MEQSMREQLQAFLKSAEKSADALEMEGLVVAASYLLGCVQTVQHILDTEPPAVSVKAGWVPVTERLPTYEGFVFVRTIHDVTDITYHLGDLGWGGYDANEIIHWHAIEYPQPPEVT